MVRAYTWLADAKRVLSLTVTVTLKGLPVLLVGVPEMIPVAGSIASPDGKPVADQV
jgi:hypothetical protein